MSKRLAGRLGYPADDPFRVTLHPDKLELPLRWRKPRRIFVNSMSDLFHPDVPDEFIDRVFAVMARCPQHTFQVLTKRPERMLAYFAVDTRSLDVYGTMAFNELPARTSWPLPNVWLGVSVENQQAADERIPLLLQTPAAVRFISAEPLLGPVDLLQAAGIESTGYGETFGFIDWVIVGGESGPGARPMHPDWARQIRDACKAAGVPFLFKQHGEFCFPSQMPEDVWDALNDRHPTGEIAEEPYRVGKKAAGRLLDGVLHDEYPGVGS